MIDRDISAILLMFLCVVLQIATPMLPAIAIYRIFPDTRVGATGVLSGISFKASGAFAGYLLVFAAMLAPSLKILDSIGGLLHPAWLLNARVTAVDENGAEIQHALLEVTLPEFQRSESNQITVPIPEREGRWPHVRIAALEMQHGQFVEIGAVPIDLNDEDAQVMDVDSYRKEIRIQGNVQIRRFRSQYAGGDYQPATSTLERLPEPSSPSPGAGVAP